MTDSGTDPAVFSEPPPMVQRTSIAGLIGLVLGAVAMLAAFAGPWAFASWVLALPALILGLVGASRKQDKNALPIAALVTSMTAVIISLFVLIGFYAFSETGQLRGDVADSDREPVFALEPDATQGELTVYAPGETWQHDTSWGDEQATLWDVTIDGLVALPFADWAADDEGDCYAIIGTLRPTYITDGASETALRDTPLPGLYVDGLLVEEYGSCDLEAVVAAGYESVYTSAVPLGTDLKFYMTIAVLDRLELSGDVQYIWLGSYRDTRAGLVEPEMIELG